MEGIIGVSLDSCKDPNCESCHGADWFVMGVNPGGAFFPAVGVENPGEIGDWVTFELDGNEQVIYVVKT